jgi:hypothetical protein
MGRWRFVAGALAIVMGFFVYQYGLFLTLDHAEISLIGLGLASLTGALVPLFGSAAVAGATLQIAGAIVAITGLLACISWLGSRPKIMPMPIAAPKKSEPTAQLSVNVQKCKFCATAMEPGAAFCPSCQRAQA